MKQYYTPREIADALAVSESSVKRWVDDGTLTAVRTAGGHRRVALAEAVRFVRSGAGAREAKPVPLFGDGSAILPLTDRSVESLADRLFHALERDDLAASRAALVGAFLGGWSVPSLADGPIRLAMARIGDLWRHSREGILIEHRATDQLLLMVAHLRTLLPPSQPDAPLAIGGAPAGDPYALPSQLTAVALAELGYRDRNLGANTPFAVLMDGARRYRPRLVWLSVSAPTDDERRLKDDLATVADDLAPIDATLVFGGRLAPHLAPGSRALRFGGVSELAAYARGMLVGSGAQP